MQVWYGCSRTSVLTWCLTKLDIVLRTGIDIKLNKARIHTIGKYWIIASGQWPTGRALFVWPHWLLAVFMVWYMAQMEDNDSRFPGEMMIYYNDVIMGKKASQITGLTIVCSPVYSGADQRKFQSSTSLAFLRGIHRWPVNSPHKGPVRRKMLPFDDVIMNDNIYPINSFWPSDAISSWSTLPQVMACCPTAPKPLPEPMLPVSVSCTRVEH